MLPTGDRDKSFSAGVVGYEFNLPFSKIVSSGRCILTHAMSVFPNAQQSHHLTNNNLGAKRGLRCQQRFQSHARNAWNEDIAEGVFVLEKTVERSTTAIISPGVRYSANLPNDAELVMGIAPPIGLTSDSPDWGMFFYCAIEHAFMRTKANPTKQQAVSIDR